MFLCYSEPADFAYNGWEKYALPLGNGEIGVKVFGGIQNEMLQFNHSSLYSGGKERPGSLQNFGEIFISFNGDVPCSQNTYLRDLDFSTGSAMVACRKGMEGHNRHYFVSAPDNIFVGKIEATGEKPLDFTLYLQSEQNGEIKYENDTALLFGTVKANNGIGQEDGADRNGVKYGCTVKIISEDGEISAGSEGITVKDTFLATVIMSCSVDLAGEGDPLSESKTTVEKAAEKGVNELFKRHYADYKAYMNRMSLKIGQVNENSTTDKLLSMYKKGKFKREMEATLFEYGRYILYATSRCGQLPPANKGIWSSLNCPNEPVLISRGKNVSRAFSCGEKLNLRELTERYFDFCKEIEGEDILINPFGCTVKGKKSVEEQGQTTVKKKKIFSFSKKQENSEYDPADRAQNAIKTGDKRGAYSVLSEFISQLNPNFTSDGCFYDPVFFAGIMTDMLLKFEGDTVYFLPCLPDEWNDGSVTGISVGDICEIGFEWKNGKFKKGTLKAKRDGALTLYSDGKFIGVSTAEGEDADISFTEGKVSFSVLKDTEYILF